METIVENGFNELSLSREVLEALRIVGYERPSPIQSLSIPPILADLDLLGQAQTGTGKTAAFALPILTKLDLSQKKPQVLVLTPTRELALQVAEAFQKYAAKLPKFNVQPIYGGQDYSIQLRSLRRGVHVVVGTPGRVMDHVRRGTLKLDALKTLVLDEADEMLRMGFIDDVEWILERLPEKRQVVLFSATIPRAIARIAERYLVEPKKIRIKSKTTTADTVRQRYWIVRRIHKLDALTRILDAEPFDGSIIFVRTKLATIELAEKLKARGFAAEALNGDIAQKQREKTISLLKKGTLDILVATDVAARGLDVDRITHVINYDVPFDPESYVHRIGRTGRAGRKGDAILFVSPREQRMLRIIEKATKNTILRMELPTKEDAAKKRREEFKDRLTKALSVNDLSVYSGLVEEYVHEHEVSFEQVAAALAKLSQGERPLIREELTVEKFSESRATRRGGSRTRGERRGRDSKKKSSKPSRAKYDKRKSDKAATSRGKGKPTTTTRRKARKASVSSPR